MDFNLMPIELKKMIVSYLDTKSCRNIALTSNEMKRLAYEKIWSKPKFYKTKDIDFLGNISHLPIRELNVGDFSCSWVEIVGMVPSLQLLHVNLDSYERRKPFDTQLRHLRVPVVVYTNSFQLREDFDNFVTNLEFITVKEIIIDHSIDGIKFSFEQFTLLATRFNITILEVACLDITDTNVYDFFDVLKKLQNCKVKLAGECGEKYSITLEHLELMIQYGIQIVEIESFCLRTERENDTLLKFADVMRKMKHLEKFEFDCEDFEDENAPPMELLTDLPFKYLTSYQFKVYGKGDVSKMAKTLALIKSLDGNLSQSSCSGFHLKRNFVSDYLLTHEDFELLKNLPVTLVDLHALDLTKDNINVFSEIMKQMKIQEIEYDEDELFGNKDFRIDVERFGPGGVYNTINDFTKIQ